MKFLINIGTILSGKAGEYLLGFVLVPILTQSLAPAQFGQLDLLQTIATLSVIFLACEVWGIVGKRLLANGPLSEEGLRSASSGFTFVIFSNTLFSLGFIAISPLISRYVLPGLPEGALLLFPVMVSTHVVYQYLNSLLQNGGRLKLNRIIILTVAALNVGSALVLVKVFKLGINGVLSAQLLSYTIGLILAWSFVKCLIRIQWDREALKSLLRVSLPLVPATLSAALITVGDRWFLQAHVPLADIGIYGFAAKISIAVHGVLYTFVLAYTLEFYKVKERKHDLRIKTFLVVSVYSLCVISLAASTFFPEIVRLLAPESYRAAASIGPLLIAGSVFYWMTNMLWLELIAREQTKALGLAMIAAAGLSLLSNAMIIPIAGIMGAAAVNAFTYATLLLAMTLYLHRRDAFTHGGGRAIGLIMLSSTLVLAEKTVLQLPSMLKVPYVAICSVVLLLVLLHNWGWHSFISGLSPQQVDPVTPFLELEAKDSSSG